MTLSDLVFGKLKDFKFGHCFHSIPTPTSRMIPYSDIFADFRGFPTSVVSTHSSTHIASEVSSSGTGSPQSGVNSPSIHNGIASYPSTEAGCSQKSSKEQTIEEEQFSEEQRSFKCPQCRYVTDRKNNLKRHIVTMHQECTKTLECCGIVFQSKSLLRDHVGLFHKGGYRCQICSRNFCRKALLRRHLTVHSGRKDFSCDLCGYATSHKSNLERHQKVHFRKPPPSQAGNHFQPFLGLSFDCNNIILEPARTMMTSQNSRLLPRYRLLPDRLKQTHANSNVEVQKHSKSTNRVPKSSRVQQNVLKNKNGHQPSQKTVADGTFCLSQETVADGTFCLTTEHSKLIRSRRNTADEMELEAVENSPKRQKIQNEDKKAKLPSNKYPEKHSPNFVIPTDPQGSNHTEHDRDHNIKIPKVRERLRREKQRMFATPYKCPICKEHFCFQVDLSRHHCSHPVEDNISVVTAIRKGKIKLSPS